MSRPKPIPNDQHEWLVRIHPREDTIYVSQDRSVLATQLDGFIRRDGEYGFFVEETRLISQYCWSINGRRPEPIAISNVEQHSWLGYYILFPPGVTPEPPDEGSGGLREESQLTLELRLSRSVAEGIHEDVDLTNFTQQTTKFDLELEIEADFIDQEEIGRKRQQFGKLTREWRELGGGHWELFFDYVAEHTYDNQGERGTARIRRGTAIRIENAGSPPEFREGKIRFQVELGPQESWHACVRITPHFDSKPYSLIYPCYSFFGADTEFDRRRRGFLADATRFETPQTRSLSHVVWKTLEQSKLDLATLRLYDLDHGERGWVPAAGLPTYVALFGRDSLTSAWQASLVSPDIMRGVLPELVNWQGSKIDDWRDEEPGRMLHEAHTGPLSMLNYTPRARYYGAATTSAFYPVVLAELWHWTGDEEMVRALLPAALKSIEWKDKYADHDGDGFYEYQTRSQLGNRNQGWKDSPDAIIYEDGTWVPTPIATCEEQAFMYAAKILMSEVLWWLDDKDLARRMYHEANELRKRFNERFWMEDLGYYALGLDPKKEPIRSIASNAGHCVATAIADEALVQRTVARMMSPDLFSGWGVRTLSAEHAAYDPYSYHRGSVWPVEQGTFALGFFRWGLIEELHRLTRAQFEAASLFDFNRMPEVFSGHARDERHPFPAVYPKSDWPQAWSASAVFSMAQALVGLYPYAPLKLLLLDPHLPEWLPELTIRRLHVAGAMVDIRFYRTADGSSDYEVLQLEGSLHVIRQPSPWSFTATWAERLKDALTSLLPGK